MKSYSVEYFENLSSWKRVPILQAFSFPWNERKPDEMLFQAWHDKEFLYFRFKVKDSEPKIFVKTNYKMEVLNSERVELFLRSNSAMKPYYCFEIDPTGRVMDYKTNYYREFDYLWEWPDDLNIVGAVDEEGYEVSGRIKFSTLRGFDLLKANRLEVGVFRGKCIALYDDIAQFNWSTWVDPETDKPDFHVDTAFGEFVIKNL